MDNELDAADALKVHRHLSACKDCQAEYRQIQKMSRLVRENIAYHAAPNDLSEKIRVLINAQAKTEKKSFGSTVRNNLRGWRIPLFVPGASFAAMALAAFLYMGVASRVDHMADEAVSDHVRSLMAEHLTDVPSSDRHTVKPWFIGKLDFAPPVLDFTPQGFALIGGRMDYLQSETVAALAYQHNKHIINLFISPVTQDGDVAQAALTKRGYNLVIWRKNNMQFIAVSDMDKNGLNTFSKLFQDGMSN
jgi:anti-sigma factor RsiW